MPTSTYLIIAAAVVLAFGLGMLALYFYYRSQFEESRVEQRSLRKALRARNEEIQKLRYHNTAEEPQTLSVETSEAVETLRDEIEQKNIELSILRQDYDLDVGLLKSEVEQLRTRLAEATPPVPAEPAFPPHPEPAPFAADHNGDGHLDRPTFVPLISLFATETAVGDQLTRIEGIDGTIEADLHTLGYTSFAQMARLNMAEAHRLAHTLNVPVEQILYQWIPRAQMLQYES